MKTTTKEHWDHIYSTKSEQEVSWTQARPEMSIYFIEKLGIGKAEAVIDIGGGDSHLVDYLLEQGFSDITILDISSAAIARAKKRLGEKADQVHWIVSDILDFKPTRKYSLWHDRATFHFLKDPLDQQIYVNKVAHAATHLIMASFATDGPSKCSGLEICQYDEMSMKAMFEAAGFVNVECKREVHLTPFNTSQNFLFCGFQV